MQIGISSSAESIPFPEPLIAMIAETRLAARPFPPAVVGEFDRANPQGPKPQILCTFRCTATAVPLQNLIDATSRSAGAGDRSGTRSPRHRRVAELHPNQVFSSPAPLIAAFDLLD
jgi:hypothetical protein